MTIESFELPGSPTFGQTPDGRMTCQRILRVAWTDRGAFRHQLLPPSITFSTNPVQFLGAPCPYELNADGNPLMFAESFSAEPEFGEKDAIVSPAPGDYTTDAPVFYANAKFIVDYEAPLFHIPGITQYADGTFDPDPSSSLNSIAFTRQTVDTDPTYDPVPFLIHSVTSGGQFLSVSAPDFWEWQITTIPVREGVPIPLTLGTVQHDVTWLRIPAFDSMGLPIPWDRWNHYKGTCNDATITLGGMKYKLEELLFINFDREDILMTNGQRAHNIRFHFEAKRVVNNDDRVCEGYDQTGGHNHFWDDTASAFARIQDGTTSTISPYRTTDFVSLFSLAPLNLQTPTC